MFQLGCCVWILYGGFVFVSETHVVSFSADVNTTVFNISITNDNILEGSRYLYITINNNSLPDGVVTGYPSHATIIVMKGKHCVHVVW